MNDSFQGGFNFTYKFGPRLTENAEVKMQVRNNLQEKQIITSVMAVIKGQIEPGQWQNNIFIIYKVRLGPKVFG